MSGTESHRGHGSHMYTDGLLWPLAVNLGLRKNAPVRRKLRSCGQRGRRCNASAKSFLPVDFDVFGRYQDPMDPTHLMHLMHLMAKLIIRLCFMVSSA